MKKDHLEILLEDMNGKFDLMMESNAALREGQASLNKKIEDLRQENKEEHRLLQQMIGDVNKKVDKVDQKVDNLDQKNDAAHSAINKKLDTHKKETTDIKRRVSRLEAARA